eukprot:299640-Pyramimonas_sp.AAC.1
MMIATAVLRRRSTLVQIRATSSLTRPSTTNWATTTPSATPMSTTNAPPRSSCPPWRSQRGLRRPLD